MDRKDITKRQMTKIAREAGKFTVRTLRAEGIGTGEFDVIHAVRKNPGITQADICKILGLDKGAVAKQTASLEAKGYLTREKNPDDGRSRRLYATEKAEALKHSKAGIETVFYRWLLEELSDEEREAFAATLCKLYLRCKEESKAQFPEMTKRMQQARAEAAREGGSEADCPEEGCLEEKRHTDDGHREARYEER